MSCPIDAGSVPVDKFEQVILEVFALMDEYASEAVAIEYACSGGERVLYEQEMADLKVRVRDVIDRLQ